MLAAVAGAVSGSTPQNPHPGAWSALRRGGPEPQVAWAQPGADIRRRPGPDGVHLNGCLRTILGEEGKTLTGRDVTPGNTWWTFTNFPSRDDLRLLDMLSVVHDVPPVIQPQHRDLYGSAPAGAIATGRSRDT